jgi:hypothetical protein
MSVHTRRSLETSPVVIAGFAGIRNERFFGR